MRNDRCLGWSARNDNLTIVRRSASHAVLDAPRPIFATTALFADHRSKSALDCNDTSSADSTKSAGNRALEPALLTKQDLQTQMITVRSLEILAQYQSLQPLPQLSQKPFLRTLQILVCN
ncbi:hypothetical protein ALO84_100942 [Pseudomonas syringae pv. maculicola]|nr:hypothetical protein ALO84_100942 [Pseudomonas syringae pv. maculicola]